MTGIPAKDIRIGLVLYGGVSLAIYMNGIVTELWNLLRASKALQDGKAAPPADQAKTSVETWMGILSEIQEKTGAPPFRVLVDTIAGTSAGGINGVVLAKAIAEGGNLTPLTATWINEADTRNLAVKPPHSMNWALRQATNALLWAFTDKETRQRMDDVLDQAGLDRAWLYGTALSVFKTEDGTYTPLDGAKFATLLAKALGAIDAKRDEPLLPPHDALELFVTRTDMYGWPRPLPLVRALDKTELFERTNAHMAHFHEWPNKDGVFDNFDLTYAARTTAGFPGAFAQVNEEAIGKSWNEANPRGPKPDYPGFRRRVLREIELSGFPTKGAWMADGGIMNNHPFTDLIKSIESKPTAHDVHRSILYLEPDPDPQDPKDWDLEVDEKTGKKVSTRPKTAPLLRVILFKLLGMISTDPIHGDLRGLKQRNEKVLRLESDRDWILDMVTPRVAALTQGGAAPDLPSLLGETARQAMDGSGSEPPPAAVIYARVKARAILDELGVLLSEALSYPAVSRHGQFLARLLIAWVKHNRPKVLEDITAAEIARANAHEDSPETLRAFLATFDLAYRARRARAVVNVITDAYDLPGLTEDDRKALDAAKAILSDLLDKLSAPARDQTLGDKLLAALGVASYDALDGLVENDLQFDEVAALNRFEGPLEQAWAVLAATYREAARGTETSLVDALSALPTGHGIRERVTNHALAFPFVDLALYPRMRAAGITDLIPMDVMRLSPHDAQSISTDPGRIQSAKLGAFAGFTNKLYREQDVFWGRADGAERLLDLLLQASRVAGSDKAPSGIDPTSLKPALLHRVVAQARVEHEAAGPWTVPKEVVDWLRNPK